MEAFEIALRPGDEYNVVLGGLGSAGYTWEAEVDGPPGVLFVRPSPPPPANDPNARLQSFSVDVGFIIEALRPGTAEARFALKRPWEKEQPPLRSVTVRVTVS